MPITAPPTIPQITDPSTFATRAQAWVVWQADELYPAIADTASILSLSTSSTSTTSNTIGTGSKSFTVETGKGYLAGQSLSIAYTTTPTNRMFAVVTSYNSGTGALVVNVQAIEGSGTYTAWSIALAFNGNVKNAQLDNQYINDLTTATLDPSADFFAIADTSDSGNKKKALLVIKNYITGLAMSTAGASTSISVSEGLASDSANSIMIGLTSAITKTTGAWAVGSGNGGLDTGSIGNNTWYHFYLIRRPDTGVVDVVFSTNATSPTLPTNYTQFRRIFSWKTNGSAQWVSGYQVDDNFCLKTPTASESNTTIPITKQLVTLDTPLGISLLAICSIYVANSNARLIRLFSDSDTDLTVTENNLTITTSSASSRASAIRNLLTNTSSQVAWRADISTTGAYLQTLGWIDSRGK